MENFWKKLKELGREIINYKEKEMVPLTDRENKFYQKKKECYICKKEFCDNKNEKKKKLNYTKKSEISVITLKKLEDQLLVFTI